MTTQLYGAGAFLLAASEVAKLPASPTAVKIIGMQAGPNDTQKLYQQIARAIAAAIADGRYGPGDRLPSERELAEEFSVSRPTIRDAMIALEFQGWSKRARARASM